MAAEEGAPFQVTHESLQKATNTLPDNVSALGDTRQTLESRTVAASAFGEVDASAQAAQAHAKTVRDKADELKKSQGRLDDIIGGIDRTTDQTAQLDDKQAKDQREQGGKLEQTGSGAEDPGAYRPSATVINDGKDIRITPRDGSWPDMTIPNTVDAKEGFSMQGRNWDVRDPGHTSGVQSATKVPYSEAWAIANEELAKNPTPGPDRPATAQGTPNDALNIFPGSSYVVDGSVKSFVVPSPDPKASTDIIVNYTMPNHELHPGFILRRGVPAEDGTMTFQTYGEGVGWKQHGLLGPVWRPPNWGIWEINQYQIEKSILNRMGNR